MVVAQAWWLRQFLQHGQSFILFLEIVVLQDQEHVFLSTGQSFRIETLLLLVGGDILGYITRPRRWARNLDELLDAHQDKLHFLEVLLKLGEAASIKDLGVVFHAAVVVPLEAGWQDLRKSLE